MAIDEIWVFVDSDMWYMGEKSKEEFIFSQITHWRIQSMLNLTH